MLAGRVQPTSGDALVDGQSIVSSAAHARAALGFCPQQDPLLDLLTGREHLALYARLKVHLHVLQGPMRLQACVQYVWLVKIVLPFLPAVDAIRLLSRSDPVMALETAWVQTAASLPQLPCLCASRQGVM